MYKFGILRCVGAFFPKEAGQAVLVRLSVPSRDDHMTLGDPAIFHGKIGSEGHSERRCCPLLIHLHKQADDHTESKGRYFSAE